MNRHSTIRRVSEQIKQQLSLGSTWGWALGTVLLLLTLLVTAAQVTPSNSSWKMVSVLQQLSDEVEETFQRSRALLFGTVLADTDGDGVDDAVDLDDDNDGILDTQECSGSSVLEYPNGPPAGSMAGYIRDQTVIASVTDMVAGAGITLTGFTTTSKSVLNINATTYAAAVTNNEYIEYGFTTTTSLSNKQIVGVSFGRNIFNGTYKIAVAISDNNFATKQDLAVDYQSSGSGTTYLRFNLPTTTYFLSPSKSYKVRVYFYGNTTADDFDDFSIEVGSCDHDGDGILNGVDLDSDGDGCADAIEGGALFTAANLISTSALAGAVSTASTSLGVPLIAGSGQSVGYSQNATLNACTDTDGDGLGNLEDLDDDNDGILDTAEMSCNQVQNGDFSAGAQSWTVTGNASTFSDGRFYFNGSDTTPNGVASQDFTSQVGQVYSLTFNTGVAGSGAGSVGVRADVIDVATNAVLATVSILRAAGASVSTQTLPFVATGTKTRLRFTDISPNTLNLDISIDNLYIGYCDTDGDGIPNSLDLDSDGDGCSDAIEGGAVFTTANLTSTSALSGSVSSASATFGIPVIAGTGQSAGYSQNAAVNGCAETCGNGIDDDLNGYVDEFDPACASSSTVVSCTALAAPAVFNIRQNWSTSTSNGLATSQSPTVADLNGDGIPEILVAAASGTGYRYYNGKGTNATKTTNDYVITLNTPVGQPTSQAAVADIDRDGVPEVIAVSSTGFVYVFGNVGGNASGTQSNTGTTGYRYRSNVATPFFYGSPRVTDIDEDGVPEISVGTDIFKFNLVAKTLTRVVTGNTSLPHGKDQVSWGADPVIVDIIPSNPGKEIVAGSRVYAVDLVTGVTTTLKDLNSLTAVVPANSDGPTAVGDLDLDGDLDVTYADATNFYIWDPNGNKLLFRQANWTSGSLRGMPLIANIYNEQVNDGKTTNLPEVVLTTTTAISAFNLNKLTGSLWNLSTTDGSGETGITAFDLNGDGKLELIYNDENNIRVINGDLATPVNLVTFASGTATWMENPVVADVDGDGSADFATVTGSAVAFVGELRVFSGGTGAPWQAARPLWNQRGYRYLNINDNLTVPIQEQNSAAIIPAGTNRRAFNTYNAQLNANYTLPTGVVPAPDAIASVVSTTFNCPTIQVTYTVQNAGPGTLPANTPVSFFIGNPASGTATLISSTTLATAVVSGTTVTFTATLQSAVTGQKVYVAVNTNGTSLPLSGSASFGGQTSIYECDYTNNIAASAQTYTCPDTDGDGIADYVDLDDDNDGILDSAEVQDCTPDYSLEQTTENNTLLFTNCAGSVDGPGVNFYGTTITPYAGSKYIGFHETEAFTLGLTRPLVAGAKVKIGIATSIASINQWSSNNPAQVYVYASSTNCTNTQLVGITTLRNNQAAGWLYEELQFTPTGNYDKLYFVAESPQATGLVSGSTGYILVDGLNITYCDPGVNDIDGDGIANNLDLDSDGDGCPDAIEGGGLFALTNLSSTSALAGSVSSASATFGVPVIAGTGQTTGYSQNSSVVTCTDSDGDGVVDTDDLDDDNDGILDVDECKSYSVYIYDYGTGTSMSTNVPYEITGATTTTTIINQQAKPYSDLAYGGYNWKLVAAKMMPDPAGRLTVKVAPTATTTGQYVFTDAVLVTDGSSYTILDDTPTSGTAGFSYSPLTGAWTSQNIANAYQGDNTYSTTPHTGRTATYSFTGLTMVCDLDGDGIPNHLDLDSDGDGCADALEGAGPFTARNLTASPLAGGNKGSSYIGTSNDPITQNLGTTVGPTGIPLMAGTGQALGTSQSMTTVGDACIDFGEGTIDCSKTQLNPAPVAGTARQLTLMVVVNVTKAGTFPLTVSGSGMSLANGISSITTTKTGVQSFYIPLNYDGSTLSTLTFTVGRAGSCSADLTKPAKPAITDVWTLDCVPIVGPKLR